MKQVICCRQVVPNGDRRYAPQSGGVIDQDPSVFEGQENIVVVLILHNDILNIQASGPGIP